MYSIVPWDYKPVYATKTIMQQHVQRNVSTECVIARTLGMVCGCGGTLSGEVAYIFFCMMNMNYTCTSFI